MTTFLEWFRPATISQIVDDGLVFCPVRGRDVELDRCMGCNFLKEAVGDGQNVTEIRCAPSYRALIAG